MPSSPILTHNAFLNLFYSMHAGSPTPITHIEIPSVFAIWDCSGEAFTFPVFPPGTGGGRMETQKGGWSYIHRLLAGKLYTCKI